MDEIRVRKGDTLALEFVFENIEERISGLFFSISRKMNDPNPIIQKSFLRGITLIDVRHYSKVWTYKVQIESGETDFLVEDFPYFCEMKVLFGHKEKRAYFGSFIVEHSIGGAIGIEDALSTKEIRINGNLLLFEKDPIARASIGDMSKLRVEAKDTCVNAVNGVNVMKVGMEDPTIKGDDKNIVSNINSALPKADSLKATIDAVKKSVLEFDQRVRGNRTILEERTTRIEKLGKDSESMEKDLESIKDLAFNVQFETTVNNPPPHEYENYAIWSWQGHTYYSSHLRDDDHPHLEYSEQYELVGDKWIEKRWEGTQNIGSKDGYGKPNFFTDGKDLYYSEKATKGDWITTGGSWVLKGNRWENKIWYGLPVDSFNGAEVFYLGGKFYIQLYADDRERPSELYQLDGGVWKPSEIDYLSSLDADELGLGYHSHLHLATYSRDINGQPYIYVLEGECLIWEGDRWVKKPYDSGEYEVNGYVMTWTPWHGKYYASCRRHNGIQDDGVLVVEDGYSRSRHVIPSGMATHRLIQDYWFHDGYWCRWLRDNPEDPYADNRRKYAKLVFYEYPEGEEWNGFPC